MPASISQAKRDEILRLAENHTLSQQDIADNVKISISTVNRIAREARTGAPGDRLYHTEDDVRAAGREDSKRSYERIKNSTEAPPGRLDMAAIRRRIMPFLWDTSLSSVCRIRETVEQVRRESGFHIANIIIFRFGLRDTHGFMFYSDNGALMPRQLGTTPTFVDRVPAFPLVYNAHNRVPQDSIA